MLPPYLFYLLSFTQLHFNIITFYLSITILTFILYKEKYI
nr:MAG TPA: hypothetical protein [Caudoviricetes sp.]